MSKRWQQVSVVVGVIGILLTGIPAAVNFYPPLVAGFTQWLPVDLLLNLSADIGPFVLVFIFGWIIRGRVERQKAARINSIEGCIEKNDVCWNGTAQLANGRVVDFSISHKPICPHCQTPLNSDKIQTSEAGNRSPSYAKQIMQVWKCPNSECNHVAQRQSDEYEEAESLFEVHFGRITESDGEAYSLEALIQEIEGEPTPTKIWKKYAEVVDDAHASKACFH